MNQKLIEISDKMILIAALDWGMGHTTRCVSIIRTLLAQGNRVVFAGNDKQNSFIRNEFPNIILELIDGYNIQLDSNKNTYLQLASQRRKVLKAIKTERDWLKNYIVANKIDVVISDNRYGFCNAELPSILLTHQLNLQVPAFKFFANNLIKKFANNFNAIWVPDDSKQTLSGELSKQKLKVPVHYIGLLNRFDKVDAEKKYDYLVILSGPEPERTNFLEIAIREMDNLEVTAAFVGADVDAYDSFLNPTTKELETLIAQSDCVYSRAGYTTIMEMVGLRKKAVLIPTKGQYEQGYLAKHVKSTHITFSHITKRK